MSARKRVEWVPTPEQVMTEEWREAPEFPGYEVSSLGRVRSLIYRNGSGEKLRAEPLVMLPTRLRRYPAVMLYRERKQYLVYIHKLVAGAFIGPRPEGLQVAHLDGNRENNTPSNLTYATPLENSSHKFEHGTVRRGSQNSTSKLTDERVLALRHIYAAGGITIGRLARDFGLGTCTVWRALHGRTWSHVGAEAES